MHLNDLALGKVRLPSITIDQYLQASSSRTLFFYFFDTNKTVRRYFVFIIWIYIVIMFPIAHFMLYMILC